MAINVGCEFRNRVQFPAFTRSQMLTLGKLAILNRNLKSGLFLD